MKTAIEALATMYQLEKTAYLSKIIQHALNTTMNITLNSTTKNEIIPIQYRCSVNQIVFFFCGSVSIVAVIYNCIPSWFFHAYFTTAENNEQSSSQNVKWKSNRDTFSASIDLIVTPQINIIEKHNFRMTE